MSFIFLILALATAGSVVYAVQEILAKRRSDHELRDRFGPEYEELLRRRDRK